jgi:apolipoprotein D and lipocalin family protein
MPYIFFFLATLFFFVGCAPKYAPLPTVKQVELHKYIGDWYEIARFEHFFEEGCKNVSATYALKTNGDIKVTNRCTMIEDDRKKEAIGVAYATDNTNAKLKVSFFRPFYGDYWIIALADDYSYALVGAPSREYLWILSRTKTLDTATKENLIAKITDLGFDAAKLIWTVQE